MTKEKKIEKVMEVLRKDAAAPADIYRIFARNIIDALEEEEDMYYEEAVIDSVLCYRTKPDGDPDGDWIEISKEKLSKDYVWLKAEIKRKDSALREVDKMTHAIEKCYLEPDKVYIYAGRIKQAAKQALSEVK